MYKLKGRREGTCIFLDHFRFTMRGYFKEHEEVRLPWWRNMTFLSHTQGLDPLPMLQSATKANKSSFDGG